MIDSRLSDSHMKRARRAQSMNVLNKAAPLPAQSLQPPPLTIPWPLQVPQPPAAPQLPTTLRSNGEPPSLPTYAGAPTPGGNPPIHRTPILLLSTMPSMEPSCSGLSAAHSSTSLLGRPGQSLVQTTAQAAVESMEQHGKEYAERVTLSDTPIDPIAEDSDWEDADNDNLADEDMGITEGTTVSTTPAMPTVALNPLSTDHPPTPLSRSSHPIPDTPTTSPPSMRRCLPLLPCGWTVDHMEDDPYRYVSASSPVPKVNEVHSNPAVFLLYLLVHVLRTQWHLPIRGVNLVLVVIALAFDAAGASITPAPRQTYSAVMAAMNTEPHFNILPVCPECHHIQPLSSPGLDVCPSCKIPLYKTLHHPKSGTSTRRPVLQFPSKSIESQLAEILQIPGIEDSVDSWRKTTFEDKEYSSFFSSAISRELPNPDGTPFFDHEKTELPNGCLSIGLAMNIDWLVLSLLLLPSIMLSMH